MPYQTRNEYGRDEGLVLVIDVADRFMGDMRAWDIPQITAEQNVEVAQMNPSAGSLHLLTHRIQSHAEAIAKSPDFNSIYGVSPEDIGPNNRFKYDGGFADQDFVFYFAGAMANNVVALFEKQSYITTEQRANMTLGDWADLIGSGWFGDLMHDMALAQINTYGTFGKNLAILLPTKG
ncbi:MAG TPA: hypothetical protein VLH38_04485 [Patescibacteria group bacterium]|nr:hypothetical protein [Patescibacteria group bacterium]